MPEIRSARLCRLLVLGVSGPRGTSQVAVEHLRMIHDTTVYMLLPRFPQRQRTVFMKHQRTWIIVMMVHHSGTHSESATSMSRFYKLYHPYLQPLVVTFHELETAPRDLRGYPTLIPCPSSVA